MSLYFAFDLAAVARRVLYLRALKQTRTMFEVTAIIEAFQRDCATLRPWATIPI